MKQNHIPVADRLKRKISELYSRIEDSREPIGKGNPYWQCKECGISDPEVSHRNGKHFGDCNSAGLQKQITYYKNLLKEIKES